MSYLNYDLDSMFKPRAVAIIGVSPKENRATLAYRNLQELGYEGEIYFVNPKYESVHGKPCYPTVDDIPGSIQSIYISIPGDHVLPTLEAAKRKGASSAVVISSGFGEGGGAGQDKAEELARFSEENNFAVCGPNCLGLINASHRFSSYGFFFPDGFQRGNVGGVFQSGGLMHAIAGELSQRGVGLSSIVSSGNETVVNSSHYLEYLANDPNTDVIIGFLEGIKDPERFVKAAEAAYRNRKPIIVFKVGKSEKAAESAVAHTGSMTGSDQVIDTLLKQKGIIRVDDIDELIETTVLFSNKKFMNGPNLAITTTSGGEAGMYADIGEDLGIQFAEFSDATKSRLKEVLPEFGSMGNPLDTTGNAALDKDLYSSCISILAEDNQVNMIAVSQMDINESSLKHNKATQVIVESLEENSQKYDKPMICFTPNAGGADKSVCSKLSAIGVPLLIGGRSALTAINNLSWYSQLIREDNLLKESREYNKKTITPLPDKRVLTERESQELLKSYGVPIAEKQLATSGREAVDYANAIGYPVVMKVESSDVPHKSDAGGVKLNLKNSEEVMQAFEAIMTSVQAKHPNAAISGVAVEEMVQDGVEALIGVKNDPLFGPALVIGTGGVLVELLQDYATRIAPIDREDALTMIQETKLNKMLSGYRGRPKGDVEALADTLVKISQLALDYSDQIEEIDINPLLVLPENKGCRAVDGLVVLKEKAADNIKV
ncbi:acetate--CoA ligase family protein [Alteribacillus iranensis]|uniref:Acetyltransferase n=1 Tax=Alteribacillus iranensis TaxID=930128 RepID=A0A1I2BB68_9BACI|nr:acetate--CoA ligase family protein [Alteribacillus iranensis]SFE53401.1 acetyltransferase [Alteribacillus iranensis]